MIIHLKDKSFELSYTTIMGCLELKPQEALALESLKERAYLWKEWGASFMELSVAPTLEQELSAEQEAKIIVEALKVLKDSGIILAVRTSDPFVMEQSAFAGAQLIVDPLALRAPNAIETVARVGIAVCLCFDQARLFDEGDNNDPCAAISEFFYERLDACMNNNIDRQKLILDPMLGSHVSIETRLKMFGRLKTFSSFALPLSVEVPRRENASNDAEVKPSQNLAVATAIALFAEKNGVRIIRTQCVYDIAIALDTWQAMNLNARPFKLTRVIGRTLKGLAKKRNAN